MLKIILFTIGIFWLGLELFNNNIYFYFSNNDNQNFENLINKDKYQVFVFYGPTSFPINLARHPWFVLNKKGEISRWEVMHFKSKNDKSLEYIHLNERPPFHGNYIIYPSKLLNSKTKLMGYIEGDEESNAKKAIEFIENSTQTYPYYDRYNFLGPNSNTYLQNVLNKFPEFNIKLSWQFIGKNYKIYK